MEHIWYTLTKANYGTYILSQLFYQVKNQHGTARNNTYQVKNWIKKLYSRHVSTPGRSRFLYHKHHYTIVLKIQIASLHTNF